MSLNRFRMTRILGVKAKFWRDGGPWRFGDTEALLAAWHDAALLESSCCGCVSGVV